MPSCRFYPQLQLCFFLFDSNPRGRFPDLAAGYVYPEEANPRQGDLHVTDRALAGDVRKNLAWVEAFPLGQRIEKGKGDPLETRYASPFLLTSPASRTLSLLLRDPLPGFYYTIFWTLPRTEAQEPEVTAALWNHAQGIGERLLNLGFEPAITSCLAQLREAVADGQALDAALFVYAEARRGLVRVAVADDGLGFAEALGNPVVKVGRTLIGQAWRRRVTVDSVAGPTGASSEFYCDSTDPLTLHQNRVASLAIPLFYPGGTDGPRGLRVAVLWLGTTSRWSPLINLRDDDVYRKRLLELVRVWFVEKLLPIIDPSSP